MSKLRNFFLQLYDFPIPFVSVFSIFTDAEKLNNSLKESPKVDVTLVDLSHEIEYENSSALEQSKQSVLSRVVRETALGFSQYFLVAQEGREEGDEQRPFTHL